MSRGNAGMGYGWANLIVGCGQGNPFGKLQGCELLSSVENDKSRGLVAGGTQGWDAGNVEDMYLDSLEEHIQLRAGQSKQLEDCTMAEEHVVAHLHESVEEVLVLQVMTAVSKIVLSEP